LKFGVYGVRWRVGFVIMVHGLDVECIRFGG